MMKRLEPAQVPAQGIMETNDFGDSKFYRIACKCSNPDDDINLNVEADEGGVTVHVWTTVKSAWWRKRFDEHDSFIVNYCLDRVNDWLNRLDIVWSALTKGYIETESWTILDRQQAINFGNTLIKSVDDVDHFREEFRKKHNTESV